MPFNGKTLKKAEKSYLIKIIKSGKSKTRCNELLMKKFGRTIADRNMTRFARIEGLKFKKMIDGRYSGSEIAKVRGLWLLNSPEKERVEALKGRTVSGVSDKIRHLTLSGELKDGLRDNIKSDLGNGESITFVSKKYKIDKSYVSKFSDSLKESRVEIENLRRWEETDVEDLLDHIEQSQKRLLAVESEQHVANIKITTTNKYVALMFLSDIHLENVNTDLGQLRKDISIIRDTKDFYVGFGGDLIDNFYVGPHKEGIVEAVVPPKAARLAAGKLFKTIGDRLLWTIIGCHDAWDRDYADYNLPEHIARKLNIPYLGHGGDINITLNKKGKEESVLYSMHARHKYRGSSSANGTACCKEILKNIDPKFDIVAVSHNHFAEIKMEHYQRKERVFVRTGSYKKEDRFSNMLGFEPNDHDSHIPVVILNTENKNMKVVQGVNNASELLRALNK